MSRIRSVIGRTVGQSYIVVQPHSLLKIHPMEDASGSLATRVYYHLKPFVPKRLRWALRRYRAKAIRQACESHWPIDEKAGKTPEGWSGWPEGKRFGVVLTHDVESWAGVEQVKQLAELEKKHGFKSSFNLIPEGDYPVPKEIRHWLSEEGFEVGVHDLNHDGKLYDSRKGFGKKAVKINGYLRDWQATGFRSGFMLRRLNWLHDLHVDYDASTFDTDPFEPQPDGCGTIFPFVVRNTSDSSVEGYVELPYTLPQDSTLFLLLQEKSPEVWMKKLDWIAERGGMALVNIHPDYVDFKNSGDSEYLYPANLIEELLEYINERYAGDYWNPLPKDLVRWYRSTQSEIPSIGAELQKSEPTDSPR